MKDELIHEDFLTLESSILSSIEKMLLKINNIVINNFEEDLENFKELNEELIKLKEGILTANEPYGIDNCSRLIKGVFYQVKEWIVITVNIIRDLEDKNYDNLKEHYGDFV